MGLMSRSVRDAARNASRTREVKQPAPVNRNRRSAPRQKRDFSFSFKGLGMFFSWLGTLGLGVALVGFLTVGLLYGYRYLTNTPYFALKNLEVSGNLRLTSREILDIAGLHNGLNSLLVSIDDVERKLAGNPWVASVSVKRVLPDGLSVRLKEKEPRFWMRHDGVLYYADAKGKLIVPVSPDKFASFPALEVTGGAEDLAERLPELLASLSSSRLSVDVSALSLVRLSPGRGVEVFLENDSLILSIGQEEWTQNLVRLAATLADIARRGEMKETREVRVHDSRVWVIRKSPAA